MDLFRYITKYAIKMFKNMIVEIFSHYLIFSVYNEITPNVILSGPTNFAPLIYQAIKICEQVQDVNSCFYLLVILFSIKINFKQTIFAQSHWGYGEITKNLQYLPA